MRSQILPMARPMWRALQRGVPTKGRFSSTEPAGQAQKPVNAHANFYKVFARPIAKVLLMAIFTYQLSYWLWVKLEKDETKAERTKEIKQLEEKLQDAVAKKQASS